MSNEPEDLNDPANSQTTDSSTGSDPTEGPSPYAALAPDAPGLPEYTGDPSLDAYRKIGAQQGGPGRRALVSPGTAVPAGEQYQHWTKVQYAQKLGVDPALMNQNNSLLQSKVADQEPDVIKEGYPATTLLTSKGTPDAYAGTRYNIDPGLDEDGNPLPLPPGSGGAYNAEHKFADNYLIPHNLRAIENANPLIPRDPDSDTGEALHLDDPNVEDKIADLNGGQGLTPQQRLAWWNTVESAGAQSRFQMEGIPNDQFDYADSIPDVSSLPDDALRNLPPSVYEVATPTTDDQTRQARDAEDARLQQIADSIPDRTEDPEGAQAWAEQALGRPLAEDQQQAPPESYRDLEARNEAIFERGELAQSPDVGFQLGQTSGEDVFERQSNLSNSRTRGGRHIRCPRRVAMTLKCSSRRVRSKPAARTFSSGNRTI